MRTISSDTWTGLFSFVPFVRPAPQAADKLQKVANLLNNPEPSTVPEDLDEGPRAARPHHWRMVANRSAVSGVNQIRLVEAIPDFDMLLALSTEKLAAKLLFLLRRRGEHVSPYYSAK